MDTVLWIVIPCYNEEDVLPITSELFLKELSLLIEKEKISSKSRILFINDGSRDKNIPKLLEKPVADTRLHAFYGRWNLYDN